MAGENIELGSHDMTMRKVWEALGYRVKGGGSSRHSGVPVVCRKDGAPANNTEADEPPRGVGDICWDYDNEDVYICTAYASATSHTWTKVTS